jgi:hypothetical protein
MVGYIANNHTKVSKLATTKLEISLFFQRSLHHNLRYVTSVVERASFSEDYIVSD